MRLSTHQNAVSQLHAKVSRRLWMELLPELADVDVHCMGGPREGGELGDRAGEIALCQLILGPGQAVQRRTESLGGQRVSLAA